MQMLERDPGKRPQSAAEVTGVFLQVKKAVTELPPGSPQSATPIGQTKSTTTLPGTGSWNVLLVYDRADMKWAQELEKWLVALGHLLGRTLTIQHGIYDLLAGSELPNKWAQRIQAATLVLTLLSADLIANQSLYQQMQKVNHEASRRFLPVVPILIRPCIWQSAPYTGMHFSIASLPEQPISSLRDRDSGWQKVFDGLYHICSQGQ